MNLLERATLFAVKAHEGQIRKLAGTPMILHPFEVSSIIATLSTDMNTMAAGILHDTVEDCGVALDDIRQQFGDRVAFLVSCETECRDQNRSAEDTWYERKKSSLEELRAIDDREVKILWLGDKLSNLRSFCREYRKRGDEIWTHLHQHDPAMHEWYYRTIGECLSELSGADAYEEYIRLIDQLFGKGEIGNHAANQN